MVAKWMSIVVEEKKPQGVKAATPLAASTKPPSVNNALLGESPFVLSR